MKALIEFLKTALTGVVFLGLLPIGAYAGEAVSQSSLHNGAYVPFATAMIVPSDPPIFPPTQRPVGQLSPSEFMATPGGVAGTGDASRWHRRWAFSLAPLFASEALDAASSYGMRELNPLLAGPNGGFGMKATTIKFGVVGALAGAEYLVVRRHPASAKFFTIVNWAAAGATTGLAVHNYSLH